jgi:hypothetical protein
VDGPEDGAPADGRTLYRVVGRAFQRQDIAEEEHARIAERLAQRLAAQPVGYAPQSREGVDA